MPSWEISFSRGSTRCALRARSQRSGSGTVTKTAGTGVSNIGVSNATDSGGTGAGRFAGA